MMKQHLCCPLYH